METEVRKILSVAWCIDSWKLTLCFILNKGASCIMPPSLLDRSLRIVEEEVLTITQGKKNAPRFQYHVLLVGYKL